MKKTVIAIGMVVVLLVLLTFVFFSLGGSIGFGDTTIGFPKDPGATEEAPTTNPNLYTSEDGLSEVQIVEEEGRLSAIITRNGQPVTALLDQAVERVTRVDFLPDAKVAISGAIGETRTLHEVFSTESGMSMQKYYGGAFVYDAAFNLYFAVCEDGASGKIMKNAETVLFDAGASNLDANSLYIEENLLYFDTVGSTSDQPRWRYCIELTSKPGAAGVALGPDGKPLPSNERSVFSSSDDKMSVYINNIKPNRENPVEVALVLDRKKLVVPMNALVLALENVAFLDNGVAALTGHITADYSTYEMFNVATGEQYGCYFGYGFLHDGERLFYVETPKENINACYRIRDAAGGLYFEAPESEIILRDLRVEGDQLIFFTRDKSQTIGAGVEQRVTVGVSQAADPTPAPSDAGEVASTEDATATENTETPVESAAPGEGEEIEM